MKKLMVLCAMIFAAAPLFAGDLINKDSKKYDLEIASGASTIHTSIGGNTNASGQARKGTKIKIKDTGSTITVDFDGDVLIKSGKLEKK
jgi:hypothetical protein